MPTITSIMLHEHENILAICLSMEKKAQQLEAGEAIDTEYVMSVLNFLRSYADGVHHTKEEEILFRKVLEEDLHNADREIDRMMHEHIISRRLFEEIEILLAEQNKKLLIKKFKEYISMIRKHIKEEDELLFPLLEEYLSEEIKESIVEQFIELDKNTDVDKILRLKKEFESLV